MPTSALGRWVTKHEGGTRRSLHALFGSMTRAQQDKAFGKCEAAAIRAGADIGRVVNARRDSTRLEDDRLITL